MAREKNRMPELKIAICDDEQSQLDKVCRKLDEIQKSDDFKDKYKTTLKLKQFLNGEELLVDLRKNQYDAFILDIQMESIDGIELAKEIRRISKRKVTIVLLTAYKDFSLDGYKVRAFRYILKKDMDKELKEVMPFLLNKAEHRIETHVLLESGLLLPADPEYIFYMESEKQNIRVHYSNPNGECYDARIRGPLSDMAEKLLRYGFILCNRYYLVNPKKIRELQNVEIIFVNGKIIRIGKTGRKKIIAAHPEFQ